MPLRGCTSKASIRLIPRLGRQRTADSFGQVFGYPGLPITDATGPPRVLAAQATADSVVGRLRLPVATGRRHRDCIGPGAPIPDPDGLDSMKDKSLDVIVGFLDRRATSTLACARKRPRPFRSCHGGRGSWRRSRTLRAFRPASGGRRRQTRFPVGRSRRR